MGALLNARLSDRYQVAYTALEMQAAANPRMRDDPEVHRRIRFGYVQETWSSSGRSPGAAVPVELTAEPAAVTVLRSGASHFGTALDFRWLQPDKAATRAVREEAHMLGLAAMVMVDDSVIVFDGHPDAQHQGQVETGYSAWPDWSSARAATPTPQPETWERGMCLAEATRHALEEGHVSDQALPALFLGDERKSGVAADVDPGMKPEVRSILLEVDMLGFIDGSVLVGDKTAAGIWRSAPDAGACNTMLRLRYAPDRLDSWLRRNLRY